MCARASGHGVARCVNERGVPILFVVAEAVLAVVRWQLLNT